MCTNPLFLNYNTVSTENQLLASAGELLETSNRQIFMVGIGVVSDYVVGLVSTIDH